MQSKYIHTITAACPASRVAGANHLACVLGTSMSDLDTYPAPCYQDADGNLYSVIAFAAPQELVDAVLGKQIARPDHDTDNQIDMAAAGTELEAMIVVLASDDAEYVPVLASPDSIVAYVDFQPHDAIAAMGLTLIPIEEV